MADSWRAGEEGVCRVRAAEAIWTFLVNRFMLSVKALRSLMEAIRFDGLIIVGIASGNKW